MNTISRWVPLSVTVRHENPSSEILHPMFQDWEGERLRKCWKNLSMCSHILLVKDLSQDFHRLTLLDHMYVCVKWAIEVNREASRLETQGIQPSRPSGEMLSDCKHQRSDSHAEIAIPE